MSRLTKTLDEGFYVSNAHCTDELKYKLGKLEDLEDELGCPLDVVSSKKAMVVKDSEIYEVDIMAVSFTNGKIYFGSEWSFITKKIKDYKTTWWLCSDLEG